MTPTTLAYLAGLWDGEGSVAVYRTRTRFRLCVQLTQNSSRSADNLLEELPLLYGGSITRSKKRGRLVLCYKAQGVAAYFFLQNVAPYVRLKREELELAMKWWRKYDENVPLHTPDSESVMNELKWLKRSWYK